MAITLSSKGQLVIPKPIRDALGLEEGTRFRIQVAEGKIILEPQTVSLVERLYGKYADTDLLADLEEEHRLEIQDDTVLRA
ncbi:MAG: AbrB/MazE/SpoVT family DNA-binding domain-containing protein [Chloroflexota bacterium]